MSFSNGRNVHVQDGVSEAQLAVDCELAGLSVLEAALRAHDDVITNAERRLVATVRSSRRLLHSRKADSSEEAGAGCRCKSAAQRQVVSECLSQRLAVVAIDAQARLYHRRSAFTSRCWLCPSHVIWRQVADLRRLEASLREAEGSRQQAKAAAQRAELETNRRAHDRLASHGPTATHAFNATQLPRVCRHETRKSIQCHGCSSLHFQAA